jgi:ribosomal protein S18 acetylase RimI-like enzyme
VTVIVRLLQPADPLVAAQIHAVMMLAYAQEAALLQVQHFGPLDRTVADVQGSGDFFLAAFVDAQLVGVLSLGPDDEPEQLCINSLVVHPHAQRRGVGRALVLDCLRRTGSAVVAVSTGALNAPALALYRQLGFVDYRRGEIGPEKLSLLKLRRDPDGTPDAAPASVA